MLKRLSNYFHRLRFLDVIIFFFVLFTFLVNSLHESYPDEFDNILGGWYIVHGKLPYVGFFTHHGPVSYFIAAIISFFSGESFVHFRIFYGLFLVFVTYATYFFLKKRVGKEHLTFYPFFMAFLGIESTYYWFQMLLADNVAAFTILPAYALILFKSFFKKTITLKDVFWTAVLTSLGLYAALTYLYVFILLNLSILYLYYKQQGFGKHLIKRSNLMPLFFMCLPHFIFFLYLLITRSLHDYFYQSVIFNAKYYVYSYSRPAGATFINPIRQMVVITQAFLNNFYPLLFGFKSFDFAFPVNMAMAVTNAGFFVYLLLNRRFKLALLLFAIVVFTNARSNPLTSRETDYQAGVYNTISFFNMFFILPQLYESINSKIDSAKRIVFASLLLLLGLYATFATFHLLLKFSDKAVSKYMGTMPLIYDRPQIAPIINAIVDKSEYAWIGPFEYEDLLYMHAQLPSKYHVLLYGVGVSDIIRDEMMRDFNQNKPVVIYFDKDFSYFGSKIANYARPFIDFLNENYTTINLYKEENVKYQSLAPIHDADKVNIKTKLYIRKDRAEQIVSKLLAKNYIQKAQ